MSEYQEFTGKSVEEAIKHACDAFGVGLADLDFEILTPGSRGVLGMGAEPARIVAAPRSALGGSAPKRAAAEAAPLPAPATREDRPYGDRGPRRDDRGPRRDDRGDRPARSDRPAGADRGPRRDDRPEREPRAGAALSADEVAQVASARRSDRSDRGELDASEASPEALAAGREILETIMGHLGFEGVRVEIKEGETSRLNVVAEGDDHEALGSLIGRKGERLSALQHVVNLVLARKTGEWTRLLVDVEDYRGRRERQLADLAERAAGRVIETGKMLQLDPMTALERRWIHIALRDHPEVVTQSIGEEPNRRIVVLPRTP